MKIAVVGAGAIGGYLGGWLAAAGEEVTLIARGAQLAAIQRHGLRVIGAAGAEVLAKDARACEHPREAGPQDAVFLAVKAHQVAAIAPELGQLLHEQTAIVTLQNGIPWWYFHQHGGPYEGRSVTTVDPDGSIARYLATERIIGAVAYPAATLVAPGVVQVVEGRRFSLGELDGASTPRVQSLSASLTRAGFKAPVSADIRGELWLKLLGNLSFNPISALSHADLRELLQFPLTRQLSVELMREASAVAERLGIRFRIGIDQRIAGAEKVGAHKTSMLQDVEAGKPLELDALVGSVIELGRMTGVPTPHLDAVYACAALLAQTLAARHGKLGIAPR